MANAKLLQNTFTPEPNVFEFSYTGQYKRIDGADGDITNRVSH